MIGTLMGRWLRRHRVLVLALGAGLVVFEAHLLVLAEQFEGGADVGALIDALPEFFRNLVREKIRDLSMDGIVSTGFMHPIVIVTTCAATCLFATAGAADREEGLLELVLAGPVSRRTYLTAVLSCVVIISGVLPLCLWIGAGIGRLLVSTPSEQPLTVHLGIALNLWALLFAVGGLALLFSATTPRRGPAMARLAGLLVPLLLIEFMGYLWDGFDVIRWMSPFHYMQQLPAQFAGEGRGFDEFILIAIGVVAAGFGCRRFVRHDI